MYIDMGQLVLEKITQNFLGLGNGVGIGIDLGTCVGIGVGLAR